VKGETIVRTTENFINQEHYVTLFVFCGFPRGEVKRPKVWYCGSSLSGCSCLTTAYRKTRTTTLGKSGNGARPLRQWRRGLPEGRRKPTSPCFLRWSPCTTNARRGTLTGIVKMCQFDGMGHTVSWESYDKLGKHRVVDSVRERER
jgi:hypothetical protein